MKFRLNIFLTLLLLTLSHFVVAQDKLLKIEDVQNRKYYPTGIYDVKFMGDSDSYSFTKDGKTLWVGSAKEDAKEVLRLADFKTHKPLSLIGIKYLNDYQFYYVSSDNELCTYNMKTKESGAYAALEKDVTIYEVNYFPSRIAYKKDNNLFVQINFKDNQITTDGSRDIVYAEAVHRNEFGIEKGLFWSKNGEKLAFYRMDQSMVTDYPLVSTEERVAKYTPVKYPMAGMKSHEVLVGVYDVASQNVVYLKTRKDESVEEREMYLTNICFSDDAKTIYVAKLNRLQNHLMLESYDATTGDKISVLFEEKSDKYVEPEAPMVFVPNSPNQFLWLSERDGFNHIYIYDTTGKLIKQLTSGNWMIKSIEGFNDKKDEVLVYATKDSPIENNFYGINLKTGKITRYSKDNGNHNVAFNTKGNLFIDTYSNYNEVASKTQIVDKKGNILKLLHSSENPLKDIDAPTIEISTLKAKDGTELYYRMIKPKDFDPNKKYPVLVYVYGGPHAQLVTNSHLGGANNFFMFLAQQGYIVWTLDNRGSANRGYAFESAIWHNCGSIEVSDQMDGVNYLKSLPYVDSERIGVDGWSYGGFMTISLKLKNPGVFKVATAGGPVIDWKWYEVMYGERYMGSPENNPEGYKNASLLNYIDKLEGKLLLIEGYQDATVLPQHSIEFIRNSVKKGKQVDFFLYPDHEHNVRGKDRIHLYQKIYQYHKENL
ncbi:MAG: DPP IV N-terminal domain-containing protein [Bacteroidales bacterium]|nr:DPP IV N-terminal domain-containing protein [Bacteroidales bacterium]